jgi:hypothetical protein
MRVLRGSGPAQRRRCGLVPVSCQILRQVLPLGRRQPSRVCRPIDEVEEGSRREHEVRDGLKKKHAAPRRHAKRRVEAEHPAAQRAAEHQ